MCPSLVHLPSDSDSFRPFHSPSHSYRSSVFVHSLLLYIYISTLQSRTELRLWQLTSWPGLYSTRPPRRRRRRSELAFIMYLVGRWCWITVIFDPFPLGCLMPEHYGCCAKYPKTLTLSRQLPASRWLRREVFSVLEYARSLSPRLGFIHLPTKTKHVLATSFSLHSI